jgi:cell division protein FtsB
MIIETMTRTTMTPQAIWILRLCFGLNNIFGTIHNMARFEKRREQQSIIYNRVTVAILAVLVVVLGFSVYSVFEKRHEAALNAKNAQYEVATLTERKSTMQSQIDKLQTDAGVEGAIRDKYRASKDGEGLVVIVDPKSSTPAQDAVLPPKQSWWARFTELFTKK